MADLHLRMTGDSSGAKEAMHDAGLSAEKLKENVKELALEFFAFEKTKELVVDFVKESITAYADLEKSQRQLKAVAGEMTEEFVKQAEVFEKKYAVDLKATEALQTLMLRFKAAPEQVEGTTQAVLDYAAATGHDAEGATQALMRAVERGANGVKSLGIVYQSTGDKTKDLALATAELEKKYGGAAETERAGLSGSLRAVALAQEHVHEAFGGMLATLDSKFGILDKTASVFERIAHSLNSMDFTKFSSFATGLTSGGVVGGIAALALTGGTSEDPNADEALSAQGGKKTGGNFGALKTNGVGSFTDTAAKTKAPKDTSGKELKDAFGGFDDYSAEGQSKRDKYDADQKMEELDLQLHDQKMLEEVKKAAREEDDFDDAQHKKQDAATKKFLDGQQKILDDSHALEAQSGILESDQAMSILVKGDEKQEQETKRHALAMERAGAKIGSAFVNAMATELSKLADGGQFDVGAFLLDLTDLALSIAGSAVGDYLGGPVGGQVGGMVGHLAGTGIKALTHVHGGGPGPYTRNGEPVAPEATRHDGGWIEKFHAGGWPGGYGREEVPTVLQTGERVWSRAEVARAGGPGAVDAMASGGRGGGGGVTVNVQTIDGDSSRRFFENDGGRGFYNALRTGKGMLTPIFGGG